MGELRSPPSLAEVQALVARLVTLPGRVREARAALGISVGEIERVVAPGAALPAEQRLNIYAEMYFYRLVEVLGSQHERLRTALGACDAFERLVSAYLRRHPPRGHDIGVAGARLPELVATWDETRDRPWLAELARFERALADVYVAADATPLAMADLAALPADVLPTRTLHIVPAHAFMVVRHAVDEWAAALEHGPAPAPAPCFRTVLVWRKGVTVFHRPVEADDEWACLMRLARGATLAELGEVVADTYGLDAAPARLHALLARWLDDALVS